MQVRTDQLTGTALDWAVAKCDGLTPSLHRNPYGYWVMPNITGAYSADWSAGGPIVERDHIGLAFQNGEWIAYFLEQEECPNTYNFDFRMSVTGPTALVAAMRCGVASVLGHVIDVPDELVRGRDTAQTVAGTAQT